MDKYMYTCMCSSSSSARYFGSVLLLRSQPIINMHVCVLTVSAHACTMSSSIVSSSVLIALSMNE